MLEQFLRAGGNRFNVHQDALERHHQLASGLRQRDVPYDSELRRSHLRGMVAFLPAGPISHRDFVNRAWAEAPIKDVLLRMEDVGPHYANTETTASLPAAALAGRRD